MITVPIFAGQTVAVLGLGKSGISAARALHAGGARVAVWDDNASAREKAAAMELPVVDLSVMDWSLCSTLVLSPGIPFRFPKPNAIVERAQAGGCEIISDIELLRRTHPRSRFLGVTGTNGKSTTTVLLGHILEQAEVDVQTGGNLGVPALDLEPLDTQGVYLLELSSYQLDLCPTAIMDTAILLNITPDHLDRHGGMDGYIAAKKQVFANQSSHNVAIVGVDDDICRSIHDQLKKAGHQRTVGISGASVIEGGVYVENGMLIDDLEGRAEAVLDLSLLPNLPGVHNRQNVAAAYAAAKLLGLAVNDIVGGVSSYPGLVHRQERLGEIDGVVFVNDSKATNPDAAARALESYGDIYWIVGGREKDGDYEVLTSHIKNVRHAYLIGEAATHIQVFFGDNLQCHLSEDIRIATHQAFDQAVRDETVAPVVLLSPACASFDQFPNFEVRGEYFKECVARLGAQRGSPLPGNSIVAGGFS